MSPPVILPGAEMETRSRIRLEVKGIVQGVGFRPFVHRLTQRLCLSGWVRNTTYGAQLELEGPQSALERFVEALEEEKPPLAVIHHVGRTDGLPCQGDSGFQILTSARVSGNDALVSPDVATCPDCLRELFDPVDRRHRYPFINCTNCGPRFTIIRDIPYDRGNTSMAAFPMCPDCAEEYGDIGDRRYHAQPDCCPVCGPKVDYLDCNGNICKGDPVAAARQALRMGQIVAIKGLGGFHLACTLDDPSTLRELRRRKQRDEKPFALMCANVSTVRALCHVSREEEAALNSHRAPIVLLKKREEAPEFISENQDIGVMLPYTPLHHLLMEGFDCLVMTSANLSDCPVIKDNSEALEQLKGIADGFLLHDRDIVTRCDDSLIRLFRGKEYPLRRSRGYVPEPVVVENDVTGILACGAEQKASFCLGKGRDVFYSQHIGDLKNAETLAHYENQIDSFRRLFGVQVKRIVCDAHPDYLSTRYAMELAKKARLPLVQVQHHHAHMVSCMADNGLEGPCLGLIWDGVGYGTDGTVWGAECFAGDASGVTRIGSIRPMLLPGGDLCTKEIGRVAHSLLWDAGEGNSSPLETGQRDFLSRQLVAGLNCPGASSMGRLFDGVFALISGRHTVTYEGQGAVLLEAMATRAHDRYPCECYVEEERLILDTRPLIRAVFQDCARGVAAEKIAAAFMDCLVELAGLQCAYGRERLGLNRVVLSGGVFQNMYLLSGIMDRLREEGFEVFCHSRVSTNDEGISLGQMIIAAKESK